MNHSRNAASARAQASRRNADSKVASVTNTRNNKRSGKAPCQSSALGTPSNMDLPILLKGSHTAALHDTGVGFAILPTGTPTELEEGLPIRDVDELTGTQRETLVHLTRSLLVRLNLTRHSEDLRILCASEDIGCGGLLLTLPCRMDLSSGNTLDMELFLPSAKQPIRVHGTVQNVSRTVGEDVIRYIVEVKFGQLDAAIEREIAAFAHASQLQECRHMLA